MGHTHRDRTSEFGNVPLGEKILDVAIEWDLFCFLLCVFIFFLSFFFFFVLCFFSVHFWLFCLFVCLLIACLFLGEVLNMVVLNTFTELACPADMTWAIYNEDPKSLKLYQHYNYIGKRNYPSNYVLPSWHKMILILPTLLSSWGVACSSQFLDRESRQW